MTTADATSHIWRPSLFICKQILVKLSYFGGLPETKRHQQRDETDLETSFYVKHKFLNDIDNDKNIQTGFDNSAD